MKQPKANLARPIHLFVQRRITPTAPSPSTPTPPSPSAPGLPSPNTPALPSTPTLHSTTPAPKRNNPCVSA
eukprot:12218736-Alexandrium_andersonii.AAC.1